MQKIQLAQIYALPIIRYNSFLHCYPLKLANHEFDFSYDMLQIIENEKHLTSAVVIDRHTVGDVSVYYWNTIPFMIVKSDRNQQTYWVTNQDIYNLAYMYLKNKEILDQYDEDFIVYTEDSLIIPQLFEIFDCAYKQVFAESEYHAKTGVMMLGVKGILPGYNYDENDRLVFVSENTEPLADVICRGTSFLTKQKTFDPEFLRQQNHRIVEPLVWEHGNVSDYHLYRYQPNFECGADTIVDFV